MMLFTGFPLRCSYRPVVFVLVFRVEVPRWGAPGKGVHPLLRSLRLLSVAFSGQLVSNGVTLQLSIKAQFWGGVGIHLFIRRTNHLSPLDGLGLSRTSV